MGPCAKRRVRCVVITANGSFWGENVCKYPQRVCPRKEGEGYEKCKTVCGQIGHAEEVALAAAASAGADMKGSVAQLYGHTRACSECQKALGMHGVRRLYIFPELNAEKELHDGLR
jgi:deoxycytidylate deaminase